MTNNSPISKLKDQAEALIEEDFFQTVTESAGEDWLTEAEGQLAVDVYQTKDELVIKAPIAGVKPDDIDIAITDDVVTVKGHRQDSKEVESEHYFAQECYWGAFSRSVILPVATVSDKAQASFKNGILTIRLPKADQAKVRKIQVKAE
jgi:HSP20 family protein